MRLALLSLTLLAVPVASGCKLLGPQRPSYVDDRVQPAEEQGDLAFLHRACTEPGVVGDREEACRAEGRALARMATCEELPARYQAAQHGDQDYDRAMLRKFAGCRLYDHVFEDLTERVAEADGSDVPLEDAFVTYARARRGPAFLGTEGIISLKMRAVVEWLVAKQSFGHCQLLLDAAGGKDDLTRRELLAYAPAAHCDVMLPLAKELLLSPESSARSAACHALGELGGPEVAAKLQVLAETDPETWTYDDSDVVRYPVREDCRAALGRLRLRTE